MSLTLLLLLFLTSYVQSVKCKLSGLFQDFKMDHTWQVTSSVKIENGMMYFKFHKVNENVHLAKIVVKGQRVDLYFLPHSSQICVRREQSGTVIVNVKFGSFMSFVLSDTELTIDGTSFAFNSQKTECENSGHLKITSFLNNVAELKLNDSASSELTQSVQGLLELVDESCQKKNAKSCITCIEGYFVNSDGTCDPLPYGCAEYKNRECIHCVEHFILDHSTKKCEGTAALVLGNQIQNIPKIDLNFGSKSWTIQVYMMLVPESGSTGQENKNVITARLNSNTVSIRANYKYSYSPSECRASLSLYFATSSDSAESSAIQVPLGEWLLLTSKSDQTNLKYTLNVMNYGTITKQLRYFYFTPTQLDLNETPEKFILYLKELLVWNSANNPKIDTHKCKFNHAADFQPLAQFDLNFSPASTNSNIIDARNKASSVTIAYKSNQSAASLITNYQPIEQLTSDLIYSSIAQSTACVRCALHCDTCTDIFTCTSCGTGTLTNGLCLQKVVVPESGTANSTHFFFDAHQFELINYSLISALRLNSSTPLVSFSQATLSYPNNTNIAINDPNGFIVPLYELQQAASFNVTLNCTFKSNSNTYEEIFSSIALTQQPYAKPTNFQNVKITPRDSNACGCRLQTECDSQTGKCNCEDGYAGSRCTFTKSDLLSFQTQVSDSVSALESTLESATTSYALNKLKTLSNEPDTVTYTTALKIAEITSSLIQPNSTDSQLGQVVQVLSNSLSIVQRSENQVALLLAIKEVAELITQTALTRKTVFEFDSTYMIVRIINIDPTSQIQISLPDLNLQLPANIIEEEADLVQLALILFKASPYQPIAPSGSLQASDTLSLQLFADAVKQQINGLSEYIEMEFGLGSRGNVTNTQIEQIVEGTKQLSDLACSYYDSENREISTAGCSVLGVTNEAIQCGCNHMTDFMSFVKTGRNVLEDSNYSLFESVRDLNLQNLKTNFGFYFAIGFWSTFLVFGFLGWQADRWKLKHQFFQKLFFSLLLRRQKGKRVQQSLELIQQDKNPFKSDSEIKDINVKSRETTENFTRKRDSATLLTANIPVIKGTEKPTTLKVVGSKPKIAPLQTKQLESQQTRSALSTAEDLRKKRTGSFNENGKWIEFKGKQSSQRQRIKLKIDQILERERRCCCAFMKLFKFELLTNNQIYNIISHTSLLISRPVRLSLFYIAVVLQFALNGLFYNLKEDQDDLSSPFWQITIENFWVAIYSTLIAMILLLALGVLMRVPQKWIKQMEKAESIQTLKRIFRKLYCKLKCKVVSGFLFFFMLTNFLLLYIVCFCHIASTKMKEDWGRSSALTLCLDILVLEVFPAIAISILGVIRGCCRGGCGGILCLMLLIETYRFYRNMIEP